MLLRKTDLWSALMSLSLPVIQHAGMLQATGGGVLFIPTCLGCLISESIKEYRFKVCDTKSNQTLTKLHEYNEPRTTQIVGGLNDYIG
jgi:hypothetical protein